MMVGKEERWGKRWWWWRLRRVSGWGSSRRRFERCREREREREREGENKTEKERERERGSNGMERQSG